MRSRPILLGACLFLLTLLALWVEARPSSGDAPTPEVTSTRPAPPRTRLALDDGAAHAPRVEAGPAPGPEDVAAARPDSPAFSRLPEEDQAWVLKEARRALQSGQVAPDELARFVEQASEVRQFAVEERLEPYFPGSAEASLEARR